MFKFTKIVPRVKCLGRELIFGALEREDVNRRSYLDLLCDGDLNLYGRARVSVWEAINKAACMSHAAYNETYQQSGLINAPTLEL